MRKKVCKYGWNVFFFRYGWSRIVRSLWTQRTRNFHFFAHLLFLRPKYLVKKKLINSAKLYFLNYKSLCLTYLLDTQKKWICTIYFECIQIIVNLYTFNNLYIVSQRHLYIYGRNCSKVFKTDLRTGGLSSDLNRAFHLMYWIHCTFALVSGFFKNSCFCNHLWSPL